MRLIDIIAPNPLRTLSAWIEDAIQAGIPEPNAMTLATASKEGRPSARVVLAKAVTEDKIQFFTNYESRKAREMDQNPYVAGVFHWLPFSRQIRLEGTVSRLTPEESAAYFSTRPRGSQIAAWASAQSRPLTGGYDDLMEEFHKLENRFGPDEPIPCPPNWGGYAIHVSACEFWRALPSRLHDRVLCEREGARWRRTQLAP